MERHAGLKALRRAVELAVALASVCTAFALHAAESPGALLPYRVVGDGIPVALTTIPGDPRQGRVIAANSDRGNCLICHRMPIPEAPVFGDVGPPLDGVGARLSPAQLRLRLVDARKINPATVMPPYYKVAGLQRVEPKYRGRPMLSAQEIEDVLAYLATLH